MSVAIVRRFLSSLALMTLPGVAIAAEPLANFPTAQEAQQNCPTDLARPIHDAGGGGGPISL